MHEIRCTNCDSIFQLNELTQASCPICNCVIGGQTSPEPAASPDPVDQAEPETDPEISSEVFALNFAIQKLKENNKTILPKLVIIPFVFAALLSLIFTKHSRNIRITYIALQAVLLSAYFIFIRRILKRREKNLQQRLKEIKTNPE